MEWNTRLSAEALGAEASEIRELLKLLDRPGILSFAGGVPDPQLFPLAALTEIRSALEADTDGYRMAMQYGPSEGYAPLRQQIAEQAARNGADVVAGNVIVTNGAQQSLTLLAAALIDPGTRVAVEDPSYLGALQVFHNRSPQFLSVPMDRDGLDPEALEDAFRRGAKFLYTVPDFQNPTGRTLSLARRRKVVELAHAYGVAIIEDTAYRALYFDTPPPPSLLDIEAAYLGDGRWATDGLVIQLGTVSKTLMPALRVGWTLAPHAVIDKLVLLKQANDLSTCTMNQILAHRLSVTELPGHVGRLRAAYKARGHAMADTLRRRLSNEASFTTPSGGMFIWLTLPDGTDTAELLPRALNEQNIAFVPGGAFHATGGGRNTLRLSFSTCDEADIVDGMSRLADLIAGTDCI